MDRRKTYYIGIDTETCNSRIDIDGKLDLTDSLVYDIGWAVVDKKGNRNKFGKSLKQTSINLNGMNYLILNFLL